MQDYSRERITQYAVINNNLLIKEESLVNTKFAANEIPFPLVYAAQLSNIDHIQWFKDNIAQLQQQLTKNGALLFRGLDVKNENEFEACAKIFSEKLIDYTHRSTPRNKVSGKVYTSTVYPPDRSIVMHSECSWTNEWPLKLWFYCAVPAAVGGETPIADTRVIYNNIAPSLRAKFEKLGVMYVRNYHEGIDLPWQDVFNTDSPQEVEKHCKKIGMSVEWRNNGELLTTKQICQAVATHPLSGEKVWFNQAHLFHASADEENFKLLKEVFKEEDLPRNTYFGDGTPIDPQDIAQINSIYDQHCVAFPWQKNDLLLLDNMLSAHGRRPYKGERKVLVAMSDPYDCRAGYR